MHCSCISGTHWDVGTCCSPKSLPYTSCDSDPSQLWMCLSFPFISPLPWLSFGSDPICSVEMAVSIFCPGLTIPSCPSSSPPLQSCLCFFSSAPLLLWAGIVSLHSLCRLHVNHSTFCAHPLCCLHPSSHTPQSYNSCLYSPETPPEVRGVHVQLVTVQFAQLGKALLDVVQVLYSLPKGAQHFLAVGADHGVANDGGGTGEVPKGRKEPLGPGVDDQQPAEGWGTEAHTSNCSRFPTQGAAEPMPEAGPTWPGLRPHIRPL